MIAHRINAKIINTNNNTKKFSYSPIDLLDKLAENGGCSYIPDPSIWQSEIRQDSSLIGRE